MGELWSEWCLDSQLDSAFLPTVLGFTFHPPIGPQVRGP